MSAFSSLTCLTHHDDFLEQVEELQRAIHENSRKLEEVRQQRLHVEEELRQCTKELEKRVGLMMVNIGAFDMLQELDLLMEEKRQLSEQLDRQDSEHREQKIYLQGQIECLKEKGASLAAEILEVKQRLAEAKATNMAAEALIQAQTSKSKSKQGKPKSKQGKPKSKQGKSK